MVSDINVKGTNHKIGGIQADGQWVRKDVTVFSGTKFTATGTPSYTVSNYLPDNIYTYEVIVCSYATTGSTANDTCTWWAGDIDVHFVQNMGYSRTRTASDTWSAGEGIIPVKQVNGVLTLKLSVTGIGSSGTGNNGLYLRGYRRLGGTGIPPTYYTLTINPTPADATVTFNKGTVVGKTCTVTAGTSVTYTVSKSGYKTKSATVTVTANQTLNVTLEQDISITMYGYNVSAIGDGYLLGSNSLDGYGIAVDFPQITSKSGNIGASGSTITLGGDYSGTYTYSSSGNITVNGQTLYCYVKDSFYYIFVLSTAAVGKKCIVGLVVYSQSLAHPYQWTSTKVRMGTSTLYQEWTRKSSIDKTFNGS